jgi:alginate O-acetyltransferase complex protein AlgI
MVFSSMEFLFVFLPVFLLVYFLTKPKYRNVVLLAGSLLFYAYGEPVYVFLMMFSILFNYCVARRIKRFYDIEVYSEIDCSFERNCWLAVAMVFDFGMLFVFKYINFFIEIINTTAGTKIFDDVAVTLPLGISFYTFQITSYIFDVYRLKYQADKSIIKFGAYVSMFPQLIAGPIVNYSEVKKELDYRTVDGDKVEKGISLFVMGLAYKVLLANKIASLWNDVQTVGPYGINTATAWLGSWGYSFQLLFDFMGYSLMAIGLGFILGFTIPENFVDPYMSYSMTDFWRRWHVTLGRWFREYVYIPMGGNRKGKARMILAMFVVWLCTGLWHGADWNFLIWGLFLFVVMLMEKLFLNKVFEKVKPLGHLYMLIMIPLSWTIFNINDLKLLGLYLKRMFGFSLEGQVTLRAMDKLIMLGKTYWWLLLICIICCTPWPRKLVDRFYKNWICKVLLLAVFWFSVYQIAKGGSNPFLYFRF